MRNMSIALLIALSLSTPPGRLYASGQNSQVTPGPKGGRLLKMASQDTPYIELFVNQSGKVELTLLDTESQPITPHEQIVEITIGSRLNSRRVAVVKTGNDFVTTEKLTTSQPFQLTIQLKESPQDSPKTVRITIDSRTCGGCEQPEYVCKCHHTH